MSSFKVEFVADVPENAACWRRVVTGEYNSRSCIVIDEAECPFQMGLADAPGIAVTDFWRTNANPSCDPSGPDSCSLPLVFGPPVQGTVVQMLEWPPDRELLGSSDPMVAKSAITHRTDTVDVIHVVSGEIYVMLDDGEAMLKQGDTLVQRGTRHAWSNRSTKPCHMLVTMIAADRS